MFTNLTIFAKICLVLALPVLIALVLLSFAVSQLGTVSTRYAALIQNEAAAATMLARANTTLLDTGRLFYMLIAETDPTRQPAIVKDLDALEALFRERSGLVADKLPQLRDTVANLQRRYAALTALKPALTAAAASGNSAEGNQLLRSRFTRASISTTSPGRTA